MSYSGVAIAAIRGLITDALAAAGLPREDAAKCAALMGEATRFSRRTRNNPFMAATTF